VRFEPEPTVAGNGDDGAEIALGLDVRLDRGFKV
jgi:hypothetical protein